MPSSLLTDHPAETLPALARRVSSREAILDAAEAVVLADGAAHLTLDAVAERAKVSKGGLLYHFNTKEALLEGMVERQVRRIDAIRLQAMESLPPQPGRELKACVLMAAGRPAQRRAPPRLRHAGRHRQQSPGPRTRPPPPTAAGSTGSPRAAPPPGCLLRARR